MINIIVLTAPVQPDCAQRVSYTAPPLSFFLYFERASSSQPNARARCPARSTLTSRPRLVVPVMLPSFQRDDYASFSFITLTRLLPTLHQTPIQALGLFVAFGP